MDTDARVLQVNIDDIIPNRFQPRIAFDEKALNELASSIKEHGIIQPLVLRKLGDKYEIIAGERRYKAATLAGLTTVPAVLSNIDDNKSAEVALVENIQRRDLTPIEEARSYKNLLDKGYLTQDELAKKMGLSQSTIANKLRLLNLDEKVQQALLDNKISERHARALLQLTNKVEQKIWLDRIINERLTVRQLDQELKKLMNNTETDVPLVNLNPNLDEIQNNAQDINPQGNNVAQMMVPEGTMTEYSETLPPQPMQEGSIIDQAPTPEIMPQEEPAGNKFFNQLEDEPAAMDFNSAFSPEAIFNTQGAPVPSSNDEIEIFDMPTNPTIPVEEPAPVQPTYITPETSAELSPNNKFFQPEQPVEQPMNVQNTQEEVINPMSFVETLDAPMAAPVQQPTNNLNTSLIEIRSLINTLQAKGVKIKADEADLDSSYQINITIEKDSLF